VDRIRNYHGAGNLILVGGPAWCQLMGGANDDPISGADIVYVSHIYPYHWDNNGGRPTGDLSYYLGDLPNNYPVFFSEWGFQNGGNIPCDGENEDEYAAGMQNYLNAGGHSWTMWCFDPWWEPMAWGNWQFTDLLGNSLPNTGGYHGQFMKDFLYEERNNNLPGNADPGNTPAPTATPTPVATTTPTPVATTTPTPDQTAIPGMLGDVDTDGDIDIIDALLVAQFYVDLDPGNFNEAYADVDCDGDVDIIDALLIAQYYVDLVDEFC
jgi:hypothetical protein